MRWLVIHQNSHFVLVILHLAGGGLERRGGEGGVPSLRGADGSAAPLRTTEQMWFALEHNGAVSQKMIPKAKSMASCAACRTGAEPGNHDDD